MTMPLACASCRLRALIRFQAITRQRRQCLSSSSTRPQHEQPGEYVDNLLEKFDKSLQQPPAQRRPHRGGRADASQGQNATTTPVRGRYSGRPLQLPPKDAQQQRIHQDFPHGEAQPKQTRAKRFPHQSHELIEGLVALHRRQGGGLTNVNEHKERASMVDRTESADLGEGPGSQAQEPRHHYIGDTTRRFLSQEIFDAAHKFLRLQREGDPAEVWVSLQNVVRTCGHATNLKRLGRDKNFDRGLFYWTIKMTEIYVDQQKTGSMTVNSIPGPAVALRVRTAMVEQASIIWPLVLWSLAKHVANLSSTGDAQSSTAFEDGMRELMSVWSLCMYEQQQRGRERAPSYSTETLLDRPSIDFSSLPDAASFKQDLREQDSLYNLAELLDFLVMPLSFKSTPCDFDYSSAALVTLDLMQNAGEEYRAAYSKWTDLMEVVVQTARKERIPLALFKAAVESEDERAKAYYAGVIQKFGFRSRPTTDHAAKRLRTDEASDDPASESSHPLLASLDRPPALTESLTEYDRFVDDTIQKLGRALQRHSLASAKGLWQAVKENSQRFQSVQTPLALYERLLVTFIGLRDQQAVIEVWQEMMHAGHQPTAKTYSIVMQSCRYTNDFRTLEAFWSNMRKAGVEPDVHAWSTRVFCLFKSRQIDYGLRMLNQMGREWIAAAQHEYERESQGQAGKKIKGQQTVPFSDLIQRYPTTVNGVPRPDQAVMNSALAALATVDDTIIPRVLTWAHSFAIEPNLITYNILLNIAMRDDNLHEALHILRRMNNKAIAPDSQTWTILLTALFERGFLDNLAPEAQQEKVLSFISSLEAANAAPIDTKGYALLIDRLLKHHANALAADAVLQHMLTNNITPTPHIYTIIMTAHFASDPPDFGAIEALWSSIRAARAPLDSQFYDRMIEGYATHHVAAGGTGPMLSFLWSMQQQGKKASWRALGCAVRALAERGERAKAKGLVGRVRREIEVSGVSRARSGQMDFWRGCVELGVLRREEVPDLREREGWRGNRR